MSTFNNWKNIWIEPPLPNLPADTLEDVLKSATNTNNSIMLMIIQPWGQTDKIVWGPAPHTQATKLTLSSRVMSHSCLNILWLGTQRVFPFQGNISHSSPLEIKHWTWGSFIPHQYSNQYVFTCKSVCLHLHVFTATVLHGEGINLWHS